MEAGFSHVALLVPSVDSSGEYLKSCGFQLGAPEVFESEGTKELYAGTYATRSGLLLLLEAIAEGPYKRALQKRGPSLHHIAVDVLDVEAFVEKAKLAGWKLHEVSKETMEYQTAWLFLEGVPALIEIHQTKKITAKSAQVSKIGMPVTAPQLAMFKAIGLGDVVQASDEFSFTIDGRDMTFKQIAFPQMKRV